MYSPFDFDRFNRSCLEAMLGYSNAMAAASCEISRHFFSTWSDTVVHGAGSSQFENGAKWGQFGQGSSGFASPFQAVGALPAYNPWAMTQAWLDMDWMRAPAAWPMAFGMMAAGVPKGVALPTADANLAAMEACQVASEGLRKVFPGFEPMGGPVQERNFFEEARLRRSGTGRKARLALARREERRATATGFEPFFPFAYFKF